VKTCPQCDSGYPDSRTTCPTHGLPLNEIRDLRPGMVVHQSYRIVRKLGQGGMGAVYLAQHILMDEPRALKFLSPELSSDQAFTARFLREVRTLRQIRNRNVVDCGDLESAEDGSLFFSMEFVDGPDLRGLLNVCHPERSAPGPQRQVFVAGVGAESKDLQLHFGALPVELALSIARGIAEGLGAAHAKGMVHRDIKPENILMAKDGGARLPKIADFGIVATKESSTAYTRTGGTLLTMAYAAPEQWRGTAAAELDGRTDFYALGGVLYEMLTGQTVFYAENYEGWARQHQTTPPQPPSALRPELANWLGLDALVLRLLAKDRNQRPKDVAELLGLLDAVRLVPSDAHRETIKEAGKQVEGKHSRQVSLWAWVAAAVVLLAVAFAGSRIFRSKSPAATRSGVSGIPPGLIEEPLPQAQPTIKGGLPPWEEAARASQPTPSSQKTGKAAKKQDIFDQINPTKPQVSNPSVQPQDTAAIESQAEALPSRKRYVEALPLLDDACKAGNRDACAGLGRIYEHALGVSQDYPRAAALFSKACEAGSAVGCSDLGDLYTSGNGVTLDYSRAATLLAKSCDAGYTRSCSNLGTLYATGNGVAKDYSKSAILFTRSCDAGDARGCAFLGVLYVSGDGVAKDYPRAVTLYAKACDAEDAWGCAYLADMYKNGTGVGKDLGKARELYTKACSMGEESACREVERPH